MRMTSVFSSISLCLLLSFGCGAADNKDVVDTPADDAVQSDLAIDAPQPGDSAQDQAWEDTAPADLPGDLGAADASPGADLEQDMDASPEDLSGVFDSAAPDTAQDTLGDLGPATLGVISVAALKEALLAKDFLLINVHVPYSGEIPGTDKNLTYADVSAIAAFIGDDLSARVVVYCMSNYMSGVAGNALVALGYRNVSYLDGGMSAWTQAGNELVYLQ